MSRSLRVALASTLLLLGTASAVRAAKEPPKPPAEPPEVTLAVASGSAAWTMEVANVGTVPLRVVADARLLRLELAPLPATSASATTSAKGKAKPAPKPPAPTICELPAAMRGDGRALVLKPGQRYVEKFDPRLFCLDAFTKLDAGARVTAKLGWAPGKGALTPPFVVAPALTATASGSASTSSSAPRIASAKEMAAPAFEIPARVIASASASASGKPPSRPTLVARGGAARSVYAGKDAEASIVVTNESATTQAVYARPQVLGVTVRGPRGERTQCEPGLVPAPIVDFVVHLAPGASWSGEMRLDSLCPQGTFDREGLYELWPVLHVPALPWQASAFSGDVAARAPQLLRVETGKLPYQDGSPSAAPSASASARKP